MGSKRERPGSEKKRKKRAKTNGVDSPNPKTAGKDEKVDKKKDKKSSSKTPSKSSTEKPAKASTTKSETVRRQEAASQSVFLKKKIQLVVSLYPGSLRNCEESVEDSIRQLLLKYSDGLGGILMAYDNVRLKGDGTGEAKGWIMNELPFIHYNATCDALVFCPKVGSELHGVVNECFPSHVGILVFNYFNAMVSADQLRACGYTFDADLQNWVAEGGAETISIKDKINFVIEKVHECEGTVSLEGVKPSLSLLVEA